MNPLISPTVIPLILVAVALLIAVLSSRNEPAPSRVRDSAAAKAPGTGAQHSAMVSQRMRHGPDSDFVATMIPHHRDAIDIARLELEHGRDPETRKLASEIIAAQEKKIAEMTAWLEKYPPAAKGRLPL